MSSTNLQTNGDQVKKFLAGSDGGSGLIQDLLEATRIALSNVSHALGQSGSFIDTYA